MKIYVFDSWKVKGVKPPRSKFLQPVIDHWRDLGHEVQTGIWWGPDLVDWADVCYFYPVENNLKRASTETEKPPNKRIIAEAVDADIYGGHWKAVDWSWVDGLVSMSQHMLRWMQSQPPHLPDTLVTHYVPGGVDLDKWTLRQESARGYNVAWVGHYWIAKNLFGALQIFNELIRRDPHHPWHLYVRAEERWSPNWWMAHCKAYLEANPALAERVTFVTCWVPDLNEWLEDMSYVFCTSFKEAFGYALAEGAAKGLRPVIQNSHGTTDIWPRNWIFDTHEEAVQMFLSALYHPDGYRAYVADRYPLEKRLAALDEICLGGSL